MGPVSPGEAAAGTPVHDWPPEQDDTRPWDDQVPPGRDATLLAVVPIPGTGTSLAIVGYVIAASAASPSVATPSAAPAMSPPPPPGPPRPPPRPCPSPSRPPRRPSRPASAPGGPANPRCAWTTCSAAS